MIERIQQLVHNLLQPFANNGVTLITQVPETITPEICPLLVCRLTRITPQDESICQVNHRTQQLYDYEMAITLYHCSEKSTALETRVLEDTEKLQNYLRPLNTTSMIQSLALSSVQFEWHEGDRPVMSSTIECAIKAWHSHE